MKSEEQESLFQQWLKVHLGLMLKVVRSCAATPHDQDELFQDILVNLWASIPRFRGDSKETTWIYRVAFNTALSWRRGEHRWRNKHEPLLTSDFTLVSQTSTENGDGCQLIIEELYAAIRQLPKVDASLTLMHLDGLSYGEMAEVLGISENYIGVKLNRIRKQLGEMLKGVDDEL